MLIHHLKTAWRNLLKYKTQNIISILCLSVGVVCFSVMFQFMYHIAIDYYFTNIDDSTVYIEAYERTENDKKEPLLAPDGSDIQREIVAVKRDFYERLYHADIPAMVEILYHDNSGAFGEWKRNDKNELSRALTNIYTVSPHFFHTLHYRSAITGKRMPVLKEGDVVITEKARDNYFGKGTDARGQKLPFKIGGVDIPYIITDVVNVSERISEHFNNGIIICQKLPGENYRTNGNTILMKEGYTAADLHKQISSAMPEYYFKYREKKFDPERDSLMVGLLLVFLLLGSGVLIISLSGFLKMQLQLFSLRSREMALRRTMGAKPRQLFMMLAAEICIVFVATALASAFITANLGAYAIPIVEQIRGLISIDVDDFHRRAQQINIVAFFITLALAGFSVRRQLHTPVGMRVGRSGHPRTAGQSAALTIQFVTSIFLTFALLATYSLATFLAMQEMGSERVSSKPYKNTLFTHAKMDEIYPDFKEKMMTINEVENVSKVLQFQCEINQIDTTICSYYSILKNKDNSLENYMYHFLVSDAYLFHHFNIKVRTDAPVGPNEWKSRIYVPTEQAAHYYKKWNLKPYPNADVRNLFNNRSYIHVGYAAAPLNYRRPTPSFWIVDEDVEYRKEENYQLGITNETTDFLVFIKNGMYAKFHESVEKTFTEEEPWLKHRVNALFLTSLYDQYFIVLRMTDMICSLCLIIVIVSIICIIASVYSAISLECRGREKEVAVRKIHGAHPRHIVRLFGAYYLRLLCIAALIVAVISSVPLAIFKVSVGNDIPTKEWLIVIGGLVFSQLLISAITLSTIARKIYRVSRINPAEVIKKD